MKVQDKKKIILAVLVVFLAGYWLVELFVGPGNNANAPAAARKAAAKALPGAGKMAIRVDIGLLSRPRPEYKAAKNIFSPVYTKPELKKPAPPKGVKPGAPGAPPITVTPLPPLPPPPPPKPQAEIDAENAREEMKKIKVLGFLKRKGRTDVFVSLGNENFVVARGARIVKEYYVSDIGQDFVLLSDKNTGVEVRLSTETPKEGSKTIPAPGMPGGRAGAPSSSPPPMQQFPGGVGPKMPAPRHFDPSQQGMPQGIEQGIPGQVGIMPEPLKNYSVR